MAAATANTETAAAANATPACQRMNGDWKEKFQGFFQTPMEEHKACLKVTVQKMEDTVQKMVDELKEKTATWRSPKEEGNPVPVETSPKN